jgi:hypothetical protein
MYSRDFFRLTAPAVLVAAGIAGHVGAQTCNPVDPACENDRVASEQTDSDSFGPITPQWDSEGGTAVRLKLDKAVLGPDDTLIMAEVIVTGIAEGTIGVENRDSFNSCDVTVTLAVNPLIVNPVDFAWGLNPIVITENRGATLAPFDGVDDRDGPSGETFVFPPTPQSGCIKITDPGTLALFVAGFAGDQIEFTHSSNDSSSFAPCAPATFISDPLGQVQIEVRYKICTFQCDDCDNDGVCDQDEVDLAGPNSCGPDGTPDDCQFIPDCDNDGILDPCDPDTLTCVCVERNRRCPASLLLYPEFDNRRSNMTLLTVTNTNCDEIQGDVDVELIYINEGNCLENNFTIRLTPCDTYTVITSVQNPNFERGYVYAFAKSVTTGQAMSFNYLIGNVMAIGGIETFDWSINAVAFKGMTGHRSPTDLDNDNVRDLDGQEYWEAPDEILIPRFLGQSNSTFIGPFRSELVLLNLTGGAQFTTIVDFLMYNDNEEQFSAQREFRCWDRMYLIELNSFFRETFLDALGTNDPGEILGRPVKEAGWFKFDGNSASSTAEFIVDPAVYGFLVERLNETHAADLPWELCSQDNGDLLPTGIFGDPRPNAPGGALGDNQ